MKKPPALQLGVSLSREQPGAGSKRLIKIAIVESIRRLERHAELCYAVFMTDQIEDILDESKHHFDVVAESIRGDVKAVAEQVGSNTEKLDRLDQRMEHIEDDLGLLKTDLQFIKHELKAKVDRDEFAALENRVSSLESKLRH